MQIPANYIDVMGRAVSYDDKVVVVVIHNTRDTSTFVAFDKATGRKATYGFHNTPEAALRTADVFLADGGADFADYIADTVIGKVKKNSPRYSRAIDAAYAR